MSNCKSAATCEIYWKMSANMPPPCPTTNGWTICETRPGNLRRPCGAVPPPARCRPSNRRWKNSPAPRPPATPTTPSRRWTNSSPSATPWEIRAAYACGSSPSWPAEWETRSARCSHRWASAAEWADIQPCKARYGTSASTARSRHTARKLAASPADRPIAAWHRAQPDRPIPPTTPKARLPMERRRPADRAMRPCRRSTSSASANISAELPMNCRIEGAPMRRTRTLMSGILAVAFATAWLAGASLVPDTPDVGGEPEGVVRVANLIYAGDKSSKCFSDHFLTQAEQDSTISTSRRFHAVKLSSDEVFDFPLLIMTGDGEFTLPDVERQNLRRFVERGGFVLASAGCSSPEWDRSFRSEMALLFPDHPLTEIPMSHPIFHTVYDVT